MWVGVWFFLLVMGFGVFLLCSSELEQCQSCLTVSGFWSGGRQVLFKYFSSTFQVLFKFLTSRKFKQVVL